VWMSRLGRDTWWHGFRRCAVYTCAIDETIPGENHCAAGARVHCCLMRWIGSCGPVMFLPFNGANDRTKRC
jgi:hypothetical protein